MIPRTTGLALALFLCLGSSASGEVRRVPDQYATIQAAVDAALDGDEILVSPGTYAGPVVVPAIGITLRSEGGALGTVLDGTGLGEFEPFISLEDDPSGARTVDGFTFQNAGPAINVSANSNSGNHVIQNCRFIDNTGVSPLRLGGASADVLDNEFIDNTANLFGGAIQLHGSARILRNRFENNDALPFGGTTLTQGGAIHFVNVLGREGSSAEIRNNTFVDNHCTDYGGAIHVGSFHSAVISENTFDSNVADACAGAVYVAFNTQHQVTIEKNFFVSNVSPIGGAIGIDESRFTTVRSNTIIASRKGEGIRVESSQDAVVERNLVVFGQSIGISWSGSTGTLSCNNSFGNSLNYFNAPDNATNNLSEPPGFCDSVNGDYSLDATSVCLPKNNVCSVLIGVTVQGCGPVPVHSSTWGQIKSRY